MRGQRVASAFARTAGERGRPMAGPGGWRRGNARVPRGTGGSGRRWQGCIYLPYSQYTKSRGRLATRQIVVAGKARSSTAAARAAAQGRGQGGKKKSRKENETSGTGNGTGAEGGGSQRGSATRARGSFSRAGKEEAREGDSPGAPVDLLGMDPSLLSPHHPVSPPGRKK